MISKSLQTQIKRCARLLTNQIQLPFATQPESSGPGQTVEGFINESKQQKDEKFEEMAFKFEREWKKITAERESEQAAALEKELTENQKKRVDMLAKALLELNTFELRYFSTAIRNTVFQTSGIDPLKLNLDWPTLKQTDVGQWPPANPNWFLQQEAIAKLWPAGQQGFATLFGGVVGGGGAGGDVGAAASAGAQAAEAPKAEEKKEEKPAEKAKVDVELAAVDATKKIAIIKEVRELLKLGLKEAKEMVEKAPVTLKKDGKKEEAEQLKEKLTGLGCTINLL